MRVAVLVFLGGAFLAACQGTGGRDEAELRGVRAAEAAPGDRPRASPDAPAAFINRQPVPWEQIQPLLAEAAGAAVLEEVALDRMLAAEYRSRLGKDPDELSPSRVAEERQRLTESIERSGAEPDSAEELIRSLRLARGLGDARFAALLRRNALLRDLVAPQVQITDELVRQRFEVRYGPRYRARILTTATDADAADSLRTLLAEGPGDRTIRFADLAARVSTDESGARGGQIEPISPADPAYSPALRAALTRLEPGELSGVLDLQPGYGVALLEEVLPATPVDFASVQHDVEAELRSRQERLLMDNLARRLLLSAEVSPVDPALGWAWRNRAPNP